MIAFSPIRSAPATVLLRNFFSPARLTSAVALGSKNVVIIYDDRAAGNRAVQSLAGLQTQTAPVVRLSPFPWSCDLLAELSWRSRALRDLDTADLVIISLSEPDQIPAAIEHWINTWLRRPRTALIPVIAQLADGEVWTIGPAKADCAFAPESPPPDSIPRPAARSQRPSARFPFARLSARASASHS